MRLSLQATTRLDWLRSSTLSGPSFKAGTKPPAVRVTTSQLAKLMEQRQFSRARPLSTRLSLCRLLMTMALGETVSNSLWLPWELARPQDCTCQTTPIATGPSLTKFWARTLAALSRSPALAAMTLPHMLWSLHLNRCCLSLHLVASTQAWHLVTPLLHSWQLVPALLCKWAAKYRC